MGRLTQFDIFWIGLDPTEGSEMAKTRPCVVVSPDELNNYLRTVIIIPITSTIRGYPFRVPCSVSGKNGEIAVDQIRTVDKTRIHASKRLGHLSFSEIAALRDVLSEMFCK
jgi:mRNA interferase MazF